MTTRRTTRRTSKISRRTVLGALASSAVALPFLRSFPVGAEGAALPKLILIGAPNGPLVGPSGTSDYEGWRPMGYAAPESPLPDTLPHIFAPLEPHVDRLVFVEGMGRIRSPEQQTTSHAQHLNVLTGRGHFQPPGTTSDMFEGTGGGLSVDQFIGEQLGTKVLNTGFNLEGGMSPHWTYKGQAQPAVPIIDPVDAHGQIFGGGLDTAGAQKLLRQRTSVLDTIAGDLAAMEARVPAADRARLQAHLDSVRDLEQTLVETSELSCSPPGEPQSYDHLADENFPRVIGDMSSIITQALACGWGQVATLQFGNFGGRVKPRWPELGIDAGFSTHAIAHKFMGIDGAGSDGLSQAQAVPWGLKVERVFSGLVADLLQQLETTLDVDGRPMLDNTLVVYIRTMGMNHDSNNALWVCAGGNALGVRTRRFLTVSEGTGNDHRPWNDALVAMCRLMGVQVDTFGDPSLNQQPLDLS